MRNKETKNTNVLDERQMQIRAKSTLITLVFLLVCLLVATICRIVTTDNIGWEFWVILASLLVMLFCNRVLGDVEPPKDIGGKPLPLGDSKEDKRARRKDYFIQSLVFALACAVMDVILIASGKDDLTDMDLAEMIFPNMGRIETIVVTAVIAFVSMFIISFAAEYIIGEHRVKKYNRLMAKLDAEEDEE